MRNSVLYLFVKFLIRISVSIYFRKVEIAGEGNVPLSGPVLFAANHPQSGTDAFVLGHAAGRKVSYLAHSGLFRTRWKKAILSRLGVIPVYRAHEISGAADKNVAVFEACYRVLESRGAIGIFPEGVSLEERRVQKLKTGAARIALHAEGRNRFSLGVKIIPVGINFESRTGFRSRVLVSFGSPIVVSDYKDEFESDEVEAVHSLTNQIEKCIRERVVNISRTEFAEFVDNIEHVYKGEVLARSDLDVEGNSPFTKSQAVSQEIPRALDYFLECDPEVVWSIRAHLADYLAQLATFRVTDDQVRAEPTGVLDAATRFTILGLIGLPITIWGAFWNYLPYRIPGILAIRKQSSLTQTHMNQILFGIPVYLVYYSVLFAVAYSILGLTGAVIFSTSLLPTGLFARWHTQRNTRRGQMLRIAFLRATHGVQLRQLQRVRRQVVAEIDSALELYIVERDRSRRS